MLNVDAHCRDAPLKIITTDFGEKEGQTVVGADRRDAPAQT